MIWKAAGLKLVKANMTFREQAEMSRSMKPSKDQVIAADENVMTIVLKGKQSDHLDTMRYQRFQELVTTWKKAIHPNMLPTKCAAKKYHSLSLQAGPTVAGELLQAAGWGWELCGGRLKPMKLWPCPSITS